MSYSACEINCNVINGVYNEEDGACYELKTLSKICIKVDLRYVEDMPPSEAEIVSNVRVTTGCFIDGQVGLYETQSISPGSDGMYRVSFTNIPVEIRHDSDPFTVFTAVDSMETTDLSIFFWLSMACLLVALVLIMYLGIYYHCYISVE